MIPPSNTRDASIMCKPRASGDDPAFYGLASALLA